MATLFGKLKKAEGKAVSWDGTFWGLTEVGDDFIVLNKSTQRGAFQRLTIPFTAISSFETVGFMRQQNFKLCLIQHEK